MVQSINANTPHSAASKTEIAQILKNRQQNKGKKSFLDKASSIVGSLMSQRGAKAALAIAIGASYLTTRGKNPGNPVPN